MARRVRIEGTVLDAFLEDEGHPGDEIMQALESIIEDLKSDPGGINEEITLVIVNDFEPEEDEDESTDEETEPTKEA